VRQDYFAEKFKRNFAGSFGV